MTASFARYLPDFEFTDMSGFHADQHVNDDEKLVALPHIDTESIRAESRAEGEAIARVELTKKFEAEHLAIENLHAAELEALRVELETRAEIADLIAGDVEAVLKPLINEAVRKRILAGLADEIRKVLALENASRIRVSGPEALVHAFREQVDIDADRLTIEENDGFDIEIEVNRTQFASRLSDWSKALTEVL